MSYKRIHMYDILLFIGLMGILLVPAALATLDHPSDVRHHRPNLVGAEVVGEGWHVVSTPGDRREAVPTAKHAHSVRRTHVIDACHWVVRARRPVRSSPEVRLHHHFLVEKRGEDPPAVDEVETLRWNVDGTRPALDSRYHVPSWILQLQLFQAVSDLIEPSWSIVMVTIFAY